MKQSQTGLAQGPGHPIKGFKPQDFGLKRPQNKLISYKYII